MINRDRVKALAKARAAMVYSVLLDRYEGSVTVPLDPSILPTGSATQVTHTVEEIEVLLGPAIEIVPPVLRGNVIGLCIVNQPIKTQARTDDILIEVPSIILAGVLTRKACSAVASCPRSRNR